MKTTNILLILLFISVTAAAQPPQNRTEPMQALDFLKGIWKGSGWIMGKETRIPLASAELVQGKLNGNALLVEGIHRGRSLSGEQGAVLFEALALVTYDPETETYSWRSATSEGRGGNFEAKVVGEETLHWGQENSFRYIITIDENGRWYETGERTRDGGKTWHQFFEMTLEKQE